MKGEAQVIERLNEALFLELGAVNQYWVHYRLLEDWGYTKIAAKERAESIEEMHHADKLIERIVFLEGHLNLQRVAPLRRRVGYLEGRAALAGDGAAGQRIGAGIDLAGDRRVGGADVLRGDQQAVGRGAGKAPAV